MEHFGTNLKFLFIIRLFKVKEYNQPYRRRLWGMMQLLNDGQMSELWFTSK